MITQERLKQLVSYDPETGEFRWVSRAAFNTHVGTVAGSANGMGYWTIRLDRKLMYAHRLAFIYMTGECPRYVDHRNAVKGDNRWANLRPATRAENERNKGLSKSNTSGVKGVRWSKQRSKWHALIRVGLVTKHLGFFDSKELATEFRQLAADMLHGEFARHA